MQNILNINDLPPEKLPDFWHDNARINALYAPFRDQAVNAQDWDSKLNFWKSLLNTWCNYNKCCVFTEADLKKYFIRNGRIPACLSVVLNELYKDKDLQTFDQFMEPPQQTWSGWAVNLVVKKPVVWSFNKLKNTFFTSVANDTKYVHVPSVKKLSDTLFNSVPDTYRNKLITSEEFFSVSKLDNIDSETVQLLLHYLQCQNKIVLVQMPDINNENNHNEITLVKVGSVENKMSSAVDEVDIAKYKLDKHELVLLTKIEDLEKDKTEITNNVKAYLAKGMRQMAKRCLRKQHEIEKRIEQHVGALENLQALSDRIGTAETDSKVLDSYKTGLAALKSVFKENDLSEESISDTMLDMSETLETHNDIQSALSQSTLSNADAELEDELAELLNEPSTDHTREHDELFNTLEQRLKNLQLPSVPTHSPDAKKSLKESRPF
ncbi:uncharacterized protein CBL_12764 [Carabus blaptoides fortunei]